MYHDYQCTPPLWAGGSATPLYKPYRYTLPQKVWILSRFPLKTGKEFAHFGLESGMVFEETTGVYERICRSFQLEMNQKERVMSEFEMVFKKSFPIWALA